MPLGGIAYTWPFIAGGVAAYLLGTIPFGLILARVFGKGDIRRIGSGNIGATNVLRTGRRDLALATLLLDAGKGALAVALAQRFGPHMAAIATIAVVLGHMFPVWLVFRGGKGVATSLGALLALYWPAGLAACAVWAAAAAIGRYSSLASLAALAAAPAAAYALAGPRYAEIAGVLALLVLVRHAANIGRLVRGREPRIGKPAPGESPPPSAD